MSVYMTEAEQLEVIKKWWQRHSNTITIILSIVLLLISAYKYWNWHQEKITQQASNTYEQMMQAFSNQDNKSVRAYADQLVNDYGRTVYADAARLALAKVYVLHGKNARAQQELNDVATHSKMVAIQQIAKIRLARLLAAEKSYDKALDVLSKIDSPTYLPMVNELRGDIYAAIGQYKKAVSSYKKAINDVQTHGMGNLFLEMKTNELAAMTQSMNTEEKPEHAA